MPIKFENSVIKEARRNAEINAKQSPGSVAAQAEIEFGKDRVIGVTMTHLEKVGVNPRSDFNTPIGIYAYPYEWMMSKIEKITDWSGKQISSVLPFESGAPYITFFSLKPTANVLILSEATKQDQEEAREKLMEIYSRLGGYSTEKVKSFFLHRIDGTLEYGGDDYVDPTYPGSVIWFMTYNVAKELSIKRQKDFDFGSFWDQVVNSKTDLGSEFLNSYDYTSAFYDEKIQMLWDRVIGTHKPLDEIKKLSDNQKAQLKEKLIKKIISSPDKRTKWSRWPTAKGVTVIWNKVLRELGYDAVVDDEGKGIIHKAEPYQMVILNPRVIDRSIRVKNKPEPDLIGIKTKEEIISKKLEDGTLTIPIVASILGLPKEKANADYIMNSDVNSKYSRLAPFRNMLEKHIYKVMYNSPTEDVEYYFTSIEKNFGKYSLSNSIIRTFNSSDLVQRFKYTSGPKRLLKILEYVKPEEFGDFRLDEFILSWDRTVDVSSRRKYEYASSTLHKAYNTFKPFRNWVDGLKESNPREAQVKVALNRMFSYDEEFGNK